MEKLDEKSKKIHWIAQVMKLLGKLLSCVLSKKTKLYFVFAIFLCLGTHRIDPSSYHRTDDEPFNRSGENILGEFKCSFTLRRAIFFALCVSIVSILDLLASTLQITPH